MNDTEKQQLHNYLNQVMSNLIQDIVKNIKVDGVKTYDPHKKYACTVDIERYSKMVIENIDGMQIKHDTKEQPLTVENSSDFDAFIDTIDTFLKTKNLTIMSIATRRKNGS